MIFFLHIPKTGGQTVAQRLGAAFPPERRVLMRGALASREELVALLTRHDFVSGHPGYGVLEGLPATATLVTLVREPVAHALSLYSHILRDPGNALHAAAHALSPIALFERFGHYFFDFQARALAMAFRAIGPEELEHGEDAAILARLEPAIAAFHWLVPSEQIDAFCDLWTLETGLPVGFPSLRLNTSGEEDGVPPILADWLRNRTEQFALDSLLWRRAQAAFGHRRNGLALRGHDPRCPGPDGLRGWAGEDGAALWLTQDWHPPVVEADGETYWWAGPGFFPTVRVRRAGRRTLRFQAMTFLGVYWDQIGFLGGRDRQPLPHTATPEKDASVITFDVCIDSLAQEDELVLLAVENPASVPAIDLALAVPRRGFATRAWHLE